MSDAADRSDNSGDRQSGSTSRRDFVRGALVNSAVGLILAATGTAAGAGTLKNKPKIAGSKPVMSTPVAQQPLPFGEDALAPVISANTFGFHYGKHYKTYCETTAKLIAGTPQEGASLETIIAASAANTEQKKLFNNAAQAWNHVFYWKSLSQKTQTPSGKLLDAIKRDFGSLVDLNTKLSDAAVNQFGSGWAWLVLDKGKLAVTSTSNADLPIIHGQTPLLTIDVWEHAYYLDYQNKRPDYAKAVVEKILNWEFATENFQSAV